MSDEIADDISDAGLYPDKLVELQSNLAPLYGEFDADKLKKMTKSHIDKALQSGNPFKIREFGKSMTWYNTNRCLCLDDDLSNRVVVLDFFNYSCINCLQILPKLRYIEEKYPVSQGLAVIGVQSHKYPIEKENECVKEAIIRHDIHHPVVSDSYFFLWTTLHIKEKPTVLIIGPGGHVLFVLSGETIIEEKLLIFCKEVMAYFEGHNYPLNKSDLPISLLKDTAPSSGLLYPSNICIDEKSDNVIISDTGHNRVVIVSKNGQLLGIAGSGVQDYIDGSFEEAAFNSPRGLAWREPHYVFVADTGNHTIRCLDIVKKCVTTATGADRMKSVCGTEEIIFNKEKTLLSPYDLCFGPNVGNIRGCKPARKGRMKTKNKIVEQSKQEKFTCSTSNEADAEESNIDEKLTTIPEEDVCGDLNSLYIACTGSHEIWVLFFENFVDTSRPRFRYDCKAGQLELFAGSGKKECRNSTTRLLSSFAQPSGISFSKTCEQNLFVADSESSAVRSVSMSNGNVKTVAGGPLNPTDLFDFGDKNGQGRRVKFQRPMGIAVADKDNIFVADTYNHKVKLVHPKNRFRSNRVKTYAGTGSYGNTISEDLHKCEFNEPTGLCISKDLKTLYIADTNNHCIKMVDLENNVLSLFQIQGFFNNKPIKIVNYISKTDQLSKQSVGKEPLKIFMTPGGEIRCYFTIESELHIVPIEGDNQPWKIAILGKPLLVKCQSNTLFDQRYQPSLILQDETHEKMESRVDFEVTLSFCDKKKDFCYSKRIFFKFLVDVTDENSKSVESVNMLVIAQ